MAKRIPVAERAALAERLRAVVKRLGTQADAAAIAGVSERQMRMYLAASSSLSLDAAARLADAAGVDVHWLVTGRTPPNGRQMTVSTLSPGRRLQRVGALMEVVEGIYRQAGVALDGAQSQRVAEGMVDAAGDVDDEAWDLIAATIAHGYRLGLSGSPK